MDNGVPVLVSFCLTKDEMEKQIQGPVVKMITAELFSVFDDKGQKNPGLKIDLDQFFKSEQKI